jgi:hypothetical protein
MSSPGLVDLAARLATNTLTPAQQAAFAEALGLIIPTWPTPDELSNSIPPSEESLVRLWAAVLYSLQAEGGTSMPATVVGTAIFPNIAALGAFDASGSPDGAPAFVQTVGAFFTLAKPSAVPTTPTTVVNAIGGGQWFRTATGIAAQAASQTNWYVDRVAGNDENTGLSAGAALKTKKEIIRRWGSSSPTIDTITSVIHYLTTDVGQPPDCGLFTPTLSNGGGLTHRAEFSTPDFTGTLLAVTPKNIAAGQALECSFTTTTGAVAADMILVNLTRGNSRAPAARDAGGGHWLLAQPLAGPYVQDTFAFPTEVDTWAPGDAIQGFRPLAIDIALLGGECVAFDSNFAPGHVAQQLTLIDASADDFGLGPLGIYGSGFVFCVDCVIKRACNVRLGGSFPTNLNGCVINEINSPPNVQTIGNALGSLSVAGGIIRGPAITLSGFPNNPFIAANGTLVNAQLNPSGPAGNSPRIYVDAGVVLLAQGSVDAFQGTAQVWGPGTLDVRGLYSYVGAAAVTMLPIAALMIDGESTAYSNSTTAGVTTVHGGVPLTAAALDAASGAAGFGGLAYSGGASISNGNQP